MLDAASLSNRSWEDLGGIGVAGLRALGWDCPEVGAHSGTAPAVYLDKPLSFSQPQFTHLQNGDLSTTIYLPDGCEYQML